LHLDVEPRIGHLYATVVAILAAPPIMDPGRFTQAVANNRGVRLRALDSLPELLSWLGV
jgi:hypothetical protein